MDRKNIVAIFSLLLTSFFLLPSSVRADVPIQDFFPPAKNFSDIGSLVNVLLPNVMVIAGILIFIFVIGSGFMLIQSAGSGDAQATESAKKAFTASIIGFLLIFSAYWIVQIVKFITGINVPGF